MFYGYISAAGNGTFDIHKSQIHKSPKVTFRGLGCLLSSVIIETSTNLFTSFLVEKGIQVESRAELSHVFKLI